MSALSPLPAPLPAGWTLGPSRLNASSSSRPSSCTTSCLCGCRTEWRSWRTSPMACQPSHMSSRYAGQVKPALSGFRPAKYEGRAAPGSASWPHPSTSTHPQQRLLGNECWFWTLHWSRCTHSCMPPFTSFLTLLRWPLMPAALCMGAAGSRLVCGVVPRAARLPQGP